MKEMASECECIGSFLITSLGMLNTLPHRKTDWGEGGLQALNDFGEDADRQCYKGVVKSKLPREQYTMVIPLTLVIRLSRRYCKEK